MAESVVVCCDCAVLPRRRGLSPTPQREGCCLPFCSACTAFKPPIFDLDFDYYFFLSLSKKQQWNFIESINFLGVTAVENNYQEDRTGQAGHGSRLECMAFHLHFKKLDWSIKMYILILSRVPVAIKEPLKVSSKRLGRVGAATCECQDYSFLR